VRRRAARRAAPPQGAPPRRKARGRAAAPQGVPSARHSLTSTIIVPICWEDPGLWEDLVHYRAPFPPGSPDPPRLSDPSRTNTCTASTRHHSHSPTTRQQAAAPRIPQAHGPDHSSRRSDGRSSLDDQPTDRPGASRCAMLPYRAWVPRALALPGLGAACARLRVDRDAREVRFHSSCRSWVWIIVVDPACATTLGSPSSLDPPLSKSTTITGELLWLAWGQRPPGMAEISQARPSRSRAHRDADGNRRPGQIGCTAGVVPAAGTEDTFPFLCAFLAGYGCHRPSAP
jgi:hypothetical protein